MPRAHERARRGSRREPGRACSPRGGTRSRAPATRRTARAARASPPCSGQRPVQRCEELDETEVGDEPGVVPAEALQRDDSDAPRSDAALASETCVSASSAEVPRPRGRSSGRAASRVAARSPPARSRRARGRRAARAPPLGGSSPHARITARSISTRPPDWMSWPQIASSVACATVAFRRGRSPRSARTERPSSGSRREPAMELGRVVVEREHEARLVDRLLARGAHDDRSVGRPAGPMPTVRRAASPSTRPVRAVSRSEYGPACSEAALDHASPPYSTTRGPDTSARAARRRRSHCAPGSGSSGSSSTSCSRLPRPPCSTSARTRLGFGEGDGCGTLNFFEERYPWPERITALGLHDGSGFRERYPGIRVRAGRRAARFHSTDGEFDIVFSNAVIEHVGGRERQRRFVSEALRVGRSVFVTTPNRRFPLEVHTLLPLVHWLPTPRLRGRVRPLGKGWAKDIHLLSRRGLRVALSRSGPHRESGPDAGGIVD